MAQYYVPIIMDKNGFCTRFDLSKYNQDPRLMGHSWWCNNFVNRIVGVLYKNPMRVAWVGFCSDNNPIVLKNNLKEIAWKKCWELLDIEKALPTGMRLDNLFILNHSKKEYLDCPLYLYKENHLKEYSLAVRQDMIASIIHPLPLLTAAGNENYPGDYVGQNMDDVGVWCWDEISVDDFVPDGYSEKHFYFDELPF